MEPNVFISLGSNLGDRQANLVKAAGEGLVAADDRTVILSTGSGLKDVASALKAVKQPPITVRPALADVERALNM